MNILWDSSGFWSWRMFIVDSDMIRPFGSSTANKSWAHFNDCWMVIVVASKTIRTYHNFIENYAVQSPLNNLNSQLLFYSVLIVCIYSVVSRSAARMTITADCNMPYNILYACYSRCVCISQVNEHLMCANEIDKFRLHLLFWRAWHFWSNSKMLSHFTQFKGSIHIPQLNYFKMACIKVYGL